SIRLPDTISEVGLAVGYAVYVTTNCHFFFSSRRRHTIFDCHWSSDVCSSDLGLLLDRRGRGAAAGRRRGGHGGGRRHAVVVLERSEERRVGKECSTQWQTD